MHKKTREKKLNSRMNKTGSILSWPVFLPENDYPHKAMIFQTKSGKVFSANVYYEPRIRNKFKAFGNCAVCFVEDYYERSYCDDYYGRKVGYGIH